MAYFFTAEEIFQTAILIEQNGERFYQMLMDETKDEDIKKICIRLGDDEKKHKETFERLLKENMAKKPPVVSVKDFQESDTSYLKSLADANVFARTLSPQEIASKIKTDQATIRFALKIEQASIVFYTQMKKFTRPDWGENAVDKIIQEEQEHYKILSKLLEAKTSPREVC